MYSLPFAVFVILTFANLSVCDVIHIKQGNISGRTLKSLFAKKEYIAFQGIPFAEAPLGKLRFTPPVPHNGWSELYKADKEKEACVQFNFNIRKGQRMGKYGTEDCLYLDVFTPSIDKDKKLPVIVFLYNEQFRNSYNKTKDYAPDFFIEEEIIVVTISHRLGVFGFLSLEDDNVPGNTGIKDILIGLQWIRDNIEHFGGDPSKVTLMGTQGGAALVDILLYSEKSKDLFSGAILQSGTSLKSMYLQSGAKERAYKLAEELGNKCTTDDELLRYLNNVNPSDLLKDELKAIPNDYFRHEQKGILPFGPLIEHDHIAAVIKDFPENQESRINVPIMIGYNSREGFDGALQYLIEPKFLTYVDRDFPLLLPIRTRFRFDESTLHKAKAEIKNLYFSGGKVKISKPSEYVTYIGDVLTTYPVDRTIRHYIENSSHEAIYYFNFDYSGLLNENKIHLLKLLKVSDGTWGAAPGDELCYQFMCRDLNKTYIDLRERGAEEIGVLRNVVRLWANFAKYRNPTPLQDDLLKGFIWEPVTKEKYNYLEISKSLKMKSHPFAGRFKFWDEFINKYAKLSENGVVSHVKEEL